MPARLLMIGLDGADSRSLDRWTSDGSLPNLTALRQRGAVRTLVAPAGSTDDSLWASFQYATSEGGHGRYNYRVKRGAEPPVPAFLEEVDRDAFWHRFSALGSRTAVIDVPKTPPPRALNGIHLADWLVHGRFFKEPRSYPEGLAGEVVARFGPAPPSACGYHQDHLGDDRVTEIVANLRMSVARKRAAALHYLAAEPWDLFVVGFKECHCAGHGLWNFEDRSHPEFDEARSERLGWPVRRIFRDVDAAVGDLVAAAGADAIVFSTTEIRPNGSAAHLLPQIVERMNAELSRANWFSATWRRIRGRSPRRLEIHCEMLPHSDNTSALRVIDTRRQGADRRGRKMRRIEGLLRELRDADSGKPVVIGITHPSADQAGERSRHLPDMVIHYASTVTPAAVASRRLGRIAGENRRRRPGSHAMGGLAIATGARALPAVEGVRSLGDFEAFARRVLEAQPAGVAAPR